VVYRAKGARASRTLPRCGGRRGGDHHQNLALKAARKNRGGYAAAHAALPIANRLSLETGLFSCAENLGPSGDPII